MKTLLLVRHAKSSWDDPAEKDFDRPLNARGKKDAPEMAKRVREKKIIIDTFVSSPAKRARKTAQAFAEEFGKDKEDILFKPELYMADRRVFYEVIEGITDSSQNIAVFSHNPGITDFADGLGVVGITDMPTCAILAVKIHTDKWQDFRDAKKELIFFDYPKNEP